MPFCNKCGLELTSEDIFCPGCGQKVTNIESIATAEVASPLPPLTPLSPVNPSIPSPSQSSPMTRDESIELAEKLKKEYNNLERIQKEIDDNNAIISKPVAAVKRHSAFKFFWPFLVGSVISVNAGWILGFILMLAAGSADTFTTFVVIGVILAIVLLIAGGVHAKNQRDGLNYNAELAAKDRYKRHNELTDKNKELKTRYTATKKRLEKYNDLVPREFRTSRHMDRVRLLIQSGKANDFSEAVNSLYGESNRK